MRLTRLLLGAILMVLGMTGCNGSPTAPNPNDDGSLSDYGGSQETFHLHTQSGPLTAGQGFSYSFYSPDCTLGSTASRKRGYRR